ncbi:MAG TPA: ABC transporter permease [Caulobacteraceae bacterium]
MLRNYLAAALRNLLRNRFYAGITIAGLTLGFAAAILIALFVRDEFSYDRFIQGYGDVYRISVTEKTPTTAALESDVTEIWTAPLLKGRFPQIEEIARLNKSWFPPLVRRGEVRVGEQKFYWADPDLFKIMPLAAVAGDPATALSAPDGLVLTRAMARKYFGRDDPLGGVLLVDGHPLRVTAVIQDLPSNTHLDVDFFGSSLSAFSITKTLERVNGAGDFSFNTYTYLRLKPAASPEPLRQGLQPFFDERLPLQPAVSASIGKATVTPHLVALKDIHLRPSQQGAMKPAGDPQVIGAIALVGVLIVVIAGINFVTLMTARAGRRAVEVGVRKAAGARQRDLIAQFLGEAMIYVVVSMMLAVALAELALPAVNAGLQRTMSFNYLGDPILAGGIVAVTLVVGLLAGAYPAFVLASFRPAAVLKGGLVRGGGSIAVREGLVILQFAILIGLVVMTTTISRQTLFALNEGMRVDKDQVLLAFADPCTEYFRNQVRALPGVKAAACSSPNLLGFTNSIDAISAGVHRANIDVDAVDFGLLEVYGLKPLAGRFFQEGRRIDDFQGDQAATSSLVLNETAARKLGFASPQDAIGKTLSWRGSMRIDNAPRPERPGVVIGVAPDFTFDNIRGPIKPTLYNIGPKSSIVSSALHIKLEGGSTPEVMRGVGRTWSRLGDGHPIIQAFVDQLMMSRYIDTILQGAVIGVCSILALFIACLGLFALSAFTAEQRTKEIGVRKAMGASTGDILRLLVWRFSQPVLWANLLAWPVAWWVMDRWLHGFAYHVDLTPWTLAAASVGALAIAWATVSVQSFLVARAKPVAALRYE